MEWTKLSKHLQCVCQRCSIFAHMNQWTIFVYACLHRGGMASARLTGWCTSKTRQAAPAHKGGVFQVVSREMQHRWSTIVTIVTTPRPGDKKHFTCHAAAPALRTLDTNTMDRNIIQQSHSSWLSVGVGRKKCPHHSPRLLSRASNKGLQRFHNRREGSWCIDVPVWGWSPPSAQSRTGGTPRSPPPAPPRWGCPPSWGSRLSARLQKFWHFGNAFIVQAIQL